MKKEEDERKRRLLIPIDIWKCNEFSIIEKIICTKIRVLSKQGNKCTISNKQLIALLLVSKPTVIDAIVNLKESGIVRTSYRDKRRRMMLNEEKIKEITLADIDEKIKYVYVPDIVREMKGLSWSEKAVLFWIVNLHNKFKKCFIKNNTLAEVVQVSEKTVQRTIKKLKEMDLIEIKEIKNDTRRYIVPNQNIRWE